MSQDHFYRFDHFQFDPEGWRLLRDGREIHLEPTVLELLLYLITNRDRLVTRQELMDTVWGDTVISDSALSTAVARLRRALDEDPSAPRCLQTVHARGYRFVADVEEVWRPDHYSRDFGDLIAGVGFEVDESIEPLRRGHGGILATKPS